MVHSSGYPAVLNWDPDGGTSYSAVGQVKDIVYPSITTGDIEIADHDLTAYYKEYIPGLNDPGALTFTIGWDPGDADHAEGIGTGLIGAFEHERCTLPAWQLVIDSCNGTATWTGDGYVNGFTLNVPVEGELTADVSVKLSGKQTLAVT